MERWHGTSGGYTNHGCRCEECKQAWSAYRRERGYGPRWRRRIIALIRRRLGDRCAHCGALESDKPAGFSRAWLEIDHIEPGLRSFNPTVNAGGFEASLAEAEKCQLLCVPCHKEKTCEDRFDRQFRVPVGVVC